MTEDNKLEKSWEWYEIVFMNKFIISIKLFDKNAIPSKIFFRSWKTFCKFISPCWQQSWKWMSLWGKHRCWWRILVTDSVFCHQKSVTINTVAKYLSTEAVYPFLTLIHLVYSLFSDLILRPSLMQSVIFRNFLCSA